MYASTHMHYMYITYISFNTGEDDSRIFTLPSCCGPVTYVELSHYSFWSFSYFFTNCGTEVVSQKDRGNQLQFACACQSYFTLQTGTSGQMLLPTSLSEVITPCWFLAVYQEVSSIKTTVVSNTTTDHNHSVINKCMPVTPTTHTLYDIPPVYRLVHDTAVLCNICCGVNS